MTGKTDENDGNPSSTAADTVEKSDAKPKQQHTKKKKKQKQKQNKTDDTDVVDRSDQLGDAAPVGDKNESATIDSTVNVNDDGQGDGTDDKKQLKKSKKKSKKKKEKKASENVKSKTGEASTSDGNNGDNDDDDDDDDELLAAAALWAGDDNDDDDGDVKSSRPERPQVYSLHITQLPYDSTDFDLRKLFAEQGCAITSIRLVYDRDTEGRKTVFRGVAFVDFLDNPSYQKALKLHHKTSVRGRRLNIRPCRSKEELADIVTKTQALVREKIHQQLSGDTPKTSLSTSTTNTSKSKSKSKSKSTTEKKKSKKKTNEASSPGGAVKRKNDDPKDKTNKKPRVDKEGKPIKMTKQERNRRAAIIMQKRRRQK